VLAQRVPDFRDTGSRALCRSFGFCNIEILPRNGLRVAKPNAQLLNGRRLNIEGQLLPDGPSLLSVHGIEDEVHSRKLIPTTRDPMFTKVIACKTSLVDGPLSSAGIREES